MDHGRTSDYIAEAEEEHARLEARARQILDGHRTYMRFMRCLDRPQATLRRRHYDGRVLRELAENPGGLCVHQLLPRVDIEPTHLTHILRRLETAGLVTYEQLAWDRRYRNYSATAVGASVGIDFAEEVLVAAMELLRAWPEVVQRQLLAIARDVVIVLKHR
jgi:DNA-binding MarR family transcriptional regulator